MASILSPIWMLFQRLSLNKAVICFGHFLLILLFSVLTPVILRQVYAAKFVEHEEPLEFTFQTCDSELAGVCSYPEATIYLDQGAFELHKGYSHSFTLQISFFDTPQNRRLSLFIASIQMKDECLNVLASYSKGVPIFKSFPPAKSVFHGLVTKARNLFFLPLYLCGFFANDAVPETIIVKFPNTFLEGRYNRTKFIVVQLQNKFVQVSSSSLKINAHVGLLRRFLVKYPLSSYVLISSVSFVAFMTYYVSQWTYNLKPCPHVTDSNVSKSLLY